MNINKFIDDYNYGIESEIELLDKLRDKFDSDLKLSSSNYSLFDYESPNIYVELKSRRCSKYFYPSSIVGMNKIIRASDLKRLDIDIKIYFVFKFIDKLCYWEFNEEEMKALTQSMVTRKDRHKIETAKYLQIPINKLIDF